MSKNNSQPLVEIRMGHEKLKRFRQNTAQLCKNFRTPAHWRRETIRADFALQSLSPFIRGNPGRIWAEYLLLLLRSVLLGNTAAAWDKAINYNNAFELP